MKPPSRLDNDGVSGDVSREPVYDLAHELRHLGERWRDRFRMDRSFSEQYLKGKVTVIAVLKVFGRWGCVEVHAMIGRQFEGSDGKHWRPIGDSSDEEVTHQRNVDQWDQQFVFVGNVEVVHGSQQFVPSFVRFQRAENIDDIWSGPVYCSLRNHSLKVFRAFGEREIDSADIAPMNRPGIPGDSII